MVNIHFAPELPVSEHREEIAAALKKHQVIIVAGETGSGKTTQLPKIALELGRERIAHTQPRRIAARAVAERVAEELGTELGDEVGYQVRFTDQVSKNTKLRVMTDGILLAQIHRDRDLKKYDTIIIDEAHERSLNIDFLLGYLKRLLKKRPDLKLIITSATIDPESFAKHFADKNGLPAPVIEVSGRTYPVEMRYRPVEKDSFETLGEAVKELRREGPGDILVFFSGESEIRDAAEWLQGRAATLTSGSPETLEILPLYGRLSAAEQHRVFSKTKPGVRRLVLATNVAETSLTVPGITYVIDFGYARVSRWSARSKVQRLPIEAISQASASQRSGRAGRLRAGVAIRLYSEDDFNARPLFTEPEILRTGLAAVILQMLSLGLGDMLRFPFLTPPDKRGVSAGLQLLTELGAVRDGKITGLGRKLARLPIEPRFGRMILAGLEFEKQTAGTVASVIALVAGLTVQDVRERPEEERHKADSLHARFADPQGDLMTLLNLYNYLQKKRKELSSTAFRKLCRAEYLNYLRVREWADLERQLLTSVKSMTGQSLPKNPAPAPFELVHRAVLPGLLSQLGVRDDTSKRSSRAFAEYYGSRGTKFNLHPGSVLAKKPPELVMSVELVETSKLFARGNAVLNPDWVLEAAGDLAKSQLSEPHWSKNQGAAMAYERVTLFGIPIVERRLKHLAKTDPEHARELFIRHALTQGEWHGEHAFDRANRQLRQELEALEARERRRDLVAGDDAVYEFYDARIPKNVFSVGDFEGWWRTARVKTPKLLHLSREDLLADDGEAPSDEQFPRVWSFGDQTLKLKYRFDPTASDDGVNVMVPLPLLPRMRVGDVASIVPGLRQEMIEALIRSLPKQIRKHVVPAADWAKRLNDEIGPLLQKDQGANFLTLLAAAIQRASSQIVGPQDFDLEKIPKHLLPNYQVVDDRGKKIGSSRDLDALKKKYADLAGKTVAKKATPAGAPAASQVSKSGLTSWSFGDIATHIDSQYAGRGAVGKVRAYPTLVDRKTHVDLQLVATAEERDFKHKRGVLRLLLLTAKNTSSYINDHLTNEEKLLIAQGPFNGPKDAISEVLAMIAKEAIRAQKSDGLIFEKADFERAADDFARASVTSVYEQMKLLALILREWRRAEKAIADRSSLAFLTAAKDAKAQVAALIYPGFVSQTSLEHLVRLPTYLKAVTHRMQELENRAGRDRVWQAEVEGVLKLYTNASGELPPTERSTAQIITARWLIEELRVSLFAQQFGTKTSVSSKKIAALLQK